MRPSPRILPVAVLLCLAGCGTFYNLKAPPRSDLENIGPSTCLPVGGKVRSGATLPFGGVLRSTMLGCLGPPSGIAAMAGGDVGEEGRVGPAWFGLGVLAWADVPLSLAGDVLTLPIAYARSNGEPWATWWGEKEVSLRSPPTAIEPDAPPGGP